MSKEPAETGEKGQIARRTVIKWCLGIGAFSSLAAISSTLGTVKSLEELQIGMEIEVGDYLVFDGTGEPITVTSILPGHAARAYPQGKEILNNSLWVIHADEGALAEPTKLDWTARGFVAYSAVCTHLACIVNYSHEGMPGAEYPHIHCPCHAGVFNPQRGAEVVEGPPPRPLPQLPIEVDEEGKLVVAGLFEEPIGISGE